MSSLKRKIDVMKSPTSLIRFRNAVGVMLALSAIFAVVLSTISLPSDDAVAQQADPEMANIAERAAAWWATLDRDQRINVLEGKEADAVTDDTAVGMEATLGRQYDDGDTTMIIRLNWPKRIMPTSA